MSSIESEPPRLCDGSVTALVDDGANAVCARFAPTASMIATAALVIVATIAWRFAPRLRSRVLLGALLLSLPGFYALLVLRADAPLNAWRAAARLDGIERALEESARTRGCATEENPCEACQPITRFAHAKRGVCADASVSLAAFADDAGARCEDENLGCLPP